MVWRSSRPNPDRKRQETPIFPLLTAGFYGISLGISVACYANPLLLIRYIGAFLPLLIFATMIGVLLTSLCYKSNASPIVFWSYHVFCLGTSGLIEYWVALPSHCQDIPLLLLTTTLSMGLASAFSRSFSQKLTVLFQNPILESPTYWEETSNRVDLIPWYEAWKRLKYQVWGVTGFFLTFSGFIKFFRIPVGNKLNWLLSIALFSQFICCLLLQIQSRFAFQRASWIGERLQPNSDLKSIWIRWITGITACLILVAIFIPAGFSVQTSAPRQFRADVRRQADTLVPMAAREVLKVKKPTVGQIIIGAAGGSVLILAFLIFMSAVILFLKGILFNTVEDKPWLRVFRMVVKLCRDIFQIFASVSNRMIRNWTNSHSTVISENESTPHNLPSRGNHYNWGVGRTAIIRRRYYRIIEIFLKKGFRWQPDYTPDDFARYICEHALPAGPLPAELTAIYQKARYGPGVTSKQDTEIFERFYKDWKESFLRHS